MTKKILEEKLNQVLLSEDDDNDPLSKLKGLKRNQKREKKQRNKKESSEEMPVKKKAKFEWKPEDCAQSVGELMKVTGGGKKRKCHYEKFEFHGQQYELEDSVLLFPEEGEKNPYVAIIKDIYIQGKEGYVKLKVQWFYRPEDVNKNLIANGKSKITDSRDLFYSFHCDEVCAESVKNSCIVHFVQDNIPIPNLKKHSGFIVEYVYNTVNKKLRNFTHNDFNEDQRFEIDLLVAKTISRVSNISHIGKEKTKISLPKRFIAKPERSSFKRSNVANSLEFLADLLDREKILEMLVEVVKNEFLVLKKKQVGDCEFVWPNDDDIVHAVRVLEQVAYDSFGTDMPKYNHKMQIIIRKLKNSEFLARRLLSGRLKPEQVIQMASFELSMKSYADVKDKTLKKEALFTSKSVRWNVISLND